MMRWIALAALAAATPASPQQPATAANTPVYNVELVVFRATTALGAQEDWALEAGGAAGPRPESDSDAAAAAAPAASTARFVRELAPAEFQLNDIEARLRASSSYVPVAHIAWAQTAGQWGTHPSLPLPRGLDGTGLSGTVTLERGTFLHLGLALSYVLETPPEGLGAAPGTVFSINDSHRVRFYERNYFDHPAFGVIALVTPAQARPAGR